jgi:hypothetical protein
MFDLSLPQVCKRSLFLILALSLCVSASHFIPKAAARNQQPNNPPIAVDHVYSLHRYLVQDSPGLLVDDYDPDGEEIHLGGNIGWGATPHGALYQDWFGGFRYSPSRGFTGADVFTYAVCDYHWACSNATATFNVVNNPPTATGHTYTVHGTLNQPAPGFLANNPDPDGDPVSYSGNNGCGPIAHGYFCRWPDGRFSYSPNGGYIGTDQYAYTVCDDLGACSGDTITFNVVNSAPTVGADSYITHGLYK